MKLSQTGEFALIKRLSSRLPAADQRVVIGIGDDAAALKSRSDLLLLASTDALLEDVHFRRHGLQPADLGWKSLAVSVSDIAAMGGRPTFALITLGLPADLDSHWPEKFYDGLGDCAASYGISLVGGDTVCSRQGIFLSVTLLGEVEPDRLVGRGGSGVGDRILVSGNLGDSAAGLLLLEGHEADIAPEERKRLLTAHLRPRPRLSEAALIAAAGWATAMIDVSDGLAGDLGHLAEAGAVGMLIEAQSLPLSGGCRRVAKACGIDILQLALHGGEDYELALTVPESSLQQALDGCPGLTVIGSVCSRPGVWLLDNDGSRRSLSRGGFDHFSS